MWKGRTEWLTVTAVLLKAAAALQATVSLPCPSATPAFTVSIRAGLKWSGIWAPPVSRISDPLLPVRLKRLRDGGRK